MKPVSERPTKYIRIMYVILQAATATAMIVLIGEIYLGDSKTNTRTIASAMTRMSGNKLNSFSYPANEQNAGGTEVTYTAHANGSDHNVTSSEASDDMSVSAVKIAKEVTRTGEICKKRLPRAIIVGIQKSGTTALLKFLSAHPNVAACVDPWEPQYFSDHYDKPLDWYRNLMPCSYSNQITMEKSPPYFYRGYCAERIFIMNPKTKIIIIVKDPIVRAISMYAMLKEYDKVDGKEFEDAVTSSNRTTLDTSSRFIDFSLYSKYIKAWLDIFKLDQILVVDGHQMEFNPIEELSKVEDFLQIGHYFKKDKFTFNVTKGKYCLSINKILDCLSKSKGRKHPDVDTSIIKMMQDYFRPFNEEFFTLVHRQFNWGY